MKKAKKIGFVFVAVGAKLHIDTLHDVLPLWRSSTSSPILVVTDRKRNELPINHNRVVDIDIDDSFSHHEAAILLKTGLYDYVDWSLADYWVYLDTDILPVRLPVEDIADHFVAPITFAPDHCTMQEFALSAVHEESSEETNRRFAEIKASVKDIFEDQRKHQLKHEAAYLKVIDITKAYKREAAHNEPSDRLRKARDSYFEEKKYHKTKPILRVKKMNSLLQSNSLIDRIRGKINRFFLKKYFRNNSQYLFETDGNGLWTATDLKYKKFFFTNYNIIWDQKNNSFRDKATDLHIDDSRLITFSDYVKGHNLSYDPKSESWHNKDGSLFWKSYPLVENIYQRTGCIYNPENQSFKLAEGTIIQYVKKSTALKKTIETDFKIIINIEDWQHWNGGVFIFDKSAKSFLYDWKQRCLAAFTFPNWKTRDQGTLIATVWDHQLQDHPTLPQEWNFIADYYKEEILYKGNFEFEVFDKRITPSLLHIYHHWGDDDWQLWRDCKEVLNVTEAK